FVADPEQAVQLQQRRDGACRVGAAAEAKQVQLVAWLVVRHDERVGVANVAGDPIAECQSGDTGRQPAEPGQRSFGRHGAKTGTVVDELAVWILDRDCSQTNDVGVVAGNDLIGGAITADDEISSHAIPARIDVSSVSQTVTQSAVAFRRYSSNP